MTLSEKLLTILTIVVLLLVGANAGMGLYKWLYPSAPSAPGPVVGKRIAGFEKEVRTLIIVSSPNCHFCKESEEFWATLKPLRIIVSTPDYKQAVKEKYMPVAGGGLIPAPTDLYGFRGTPGLILIEDGKVSNVWFGKIQDEDKVRKVINHEK